MLNPKERQPLATAAAGADILIDTQVGAPIPQILIQQACHVGSHLSTPSALGSLDN